MKILFFFMLFVFTIPARADFVSGIDETHPGKPPVFVKPTPTPMPPPEFRRDRVVSVTPYFKITSFKLTDVVSGDEAVLASLIHVGFDFLKSSRIAPKFRYLILANLGFLKFKAPDEPGKSLGNPSTFRFGAGFGIAWDVNSDFEIALSQAYRNEIFVSSIFADRADVSFVMVPSTRLDLTYALFDFANYRVGPLFTYEYKLSTISNRFDVHLGGMTEFGLFAKKENITAKLFMNTRNQNTSIITESETNYVFSMTKAFDITLPEKNREP